jgi:hypothetical protein
MNTFNTLADICRPVNLEQSFTKLKTLAAYVVTFDDKRSVLVNTYSFEDAENKAKDWMKLHGLDWKKMVSSVVEEVI